jgi:hypothetical protein
MYDILCKYYKYVYQVWLKLDQFASKPIKTNKKYHFIIGYFGLFCFSLSFGGFSDCLWNFSVVFSCWNLFYFEFNEYTPSFCWKVNMPWLVQLPFGIGVRGALFWKIHYFIFIIKKKLLLRSVKMAS